MRNMIVPPKIFTIVYGISHLEQTGKQVVAVGSSGRNYTFECEKDLTAITHDELHQLLTRIAAVRSGKIRFEVVN